MKNTLKKLAVAIMLMLCALTTAVGTGAFLFYNAAGSDAVPILRDFAFMLIAEAHKRDPIEFEFDVSYIFVEINGVSTNSQWLYEMVERILPYLEYEHVTDWPRMPSEMGIKPLGCRGMSLHVAGWAISPLRTMYINEWFAETRGLEEVLGTIVHELIHTHGEVFAEGTTREVEAHTVAATVEVIAGMCLRGDDVACQAFWVEIDDLATRSFMARMEDHGLMWLSELLQDVFTRDAGERLQADKSLRYWKYDMAYRKSILINYGLYPWEEYVIEGVQGGNMMVVNDPPDFCQYYGYCRVSSMEFDDTREMLGFWVILFGDNDNTDEDSRRENIHE